MGPCPVVQLVDVLIMHTRKHHHEMSPVLNSTPKYENLVKRMKFCANLKQNVYHGKTN